MLYDVILQVPDSDIKRKAQLDEKQVSGERERDRQTKRETERETDRQTDRHRDITYTCIL